MAGGVFWAWQHYLRAYIGEDARLIYDIIDEECAEPEWVRQCLFGPPLGQFLHDRGYLVLHASAVEVDGQATVLVGHKGRGKSTTTAVMLSDGYRLVSDDIVVVGELEGQFVVWPGFHQIKLWADTLPMAEAVGVRMRRLHSNMEKYIVDLGAESMAPEPVLIKEICVLDYGEEPSVTCLSGQDAFAEVIGHLYASRFLGVEGVEARHLSLLCRLLAATRVVRWSRKKSIPALRAFVAQQQAPLVA